MTIAQIYEKAKQQLDKDEITIGEFSEIVDRELQEQQLCNDCISRAYIEPIIEELENICINGDEHILSLLSNIKNAPPVTPTITNVKNDFNIGYNCGYVDAMFDISEGE